MIQINDDWRIVSDVNNWTLEQRKVKGKKSKLVGEEYWDTEGYFGTLGQAIEFIIEREVRVSEDTLGLNQKINELKEQMKNKYNELNLKRGVF